MSKETDVLLEILEKSGGDVNALPDNLLSSHYEAIIVALGGTVDDLPDKMQTTYLKRIAECISSGGGGSGGEEWIGDGNTYIWISLQEGRTSPTLGVCPKGTVTVDWGDGTTPDVLTGTSAWTVKWTPTHEYAMAGDYVIKLTVDGEMGFYGTNASHQNSAILRHSSGADARNQVYQNSVRKVELGNGITSIGNYAFYSCYSLTSIAIPDSVTSIGYYAFQYCYFLTSIAIPKGVTLIESGVFQYCYSLTSIAIPDSVTSIGYNAFSSCYGMRYYDFTQHTAVPTLTNTNAFNGIPSDCEIRVPSALYDEWIAATNWSTLANQIVAR